MREEFETKIEEMETEKDETEKQLEFQNLDSILIQKSKEENSDYQTVKEVAVDEENLFEETKEKIKRDLTEKNWWF